MARIPLYAHLCKIPAGLLGLFCKGERKVQDIVLDVAEPGDVIWIHDYQLLLLPGLIRSVLPDITIGFFQHIPFPSYELYRLIPWRLEILEGILGRGSYRVPHIR